MLDTIWLEARRRIRAELPEKDFHTWIEPLRAASWRPGELTLEAPSSFYRDWLRRNFLGELERAVTEASGAPATVSLTVNRALDVPVAAAPARRGPLHASSPPPAARPRTPAQPGRRYTLDGFVVGASNQVAYGAALAIIEQPGVRFNPFVVYGGSGLGKTHLTRAIGQALMERQRGAVACISAEHFVNEMVGSIRGKRMERFRERFRGIETLIIDDIQFLAGKIGSQEEFRNTFNHLHDGHKQIVLACDRLPRDVPGMTETLRNRFAAGLLARIDPPDPALRQALVRRKAEEFGLDLDADVADYLADGFCANVRDLEGALKCLDASATLTGCRLTLDLARRALDAPSNGAADRPATERICRAVCAEFGLTMEELTGRRRTAEVATARQVAMLLVREETDLTLGGIGALMGGRDHSTVVYALGAIERRLRHDADVKRAVEAVRQRLRARA